MDELTQKIIFEDGSITITGLDLIEANNRAITGGSTSSGSGYISRINAKVHHSTGVISAEFYATYTNVNGGYDMIDSVKNQRVITIGGTVSSINLKLSKKREDANGAAQARLSFVVSSYGGIAGGNCWLDLRVGKDTAYTDYRF